MSTMNIEIAYQQALLANAAYIDWTAPPSGTNVRDYYVNKLVNEREFTITEAEEFVDRYTTNFVAADDYKTYSNGFSATLFYDNVTQRQVVAFNT